MKKYTLWCVDGEEEWILVADLDREELLEELNDAMIEYPEYEFGVREYQDGDEREEEIGDEDLVDGEDIEEEVETGEDEGEEE